MQRRVRTAPPLSRYCKPLAMAALWALALACPAQRTGAEEFDKPHVSADRPMDMKHIKLEMSVDLPNKHVDSVATLKLTALRPVTSVKLNAVDFTTKAVLLAVGGDATPPHEARFSNDGKYIEVFFDQLVSPGTDVLVRIEYALHEPKDGLHFFAPGDEDPEAPLQVWSQGESVQNRYWIPCFDHCNDRQTTELLVTVDEDFQVLSNGKLISDKPGPEGKHVVHWLQDKPHTVYLVTLVVGKFFTEEVTWRGIPVSYWVPEKHKDKIDNSFANTPRMLDFFSDQIGVPYPWDKYAQICCYQFGGGMENTSATTLGEDTLHDAIAHLEGDSDGLVAHELAHQWWGDLLTCRDWSHLWLNEGFATYFEALWDEHDNGPEEFAVNMLGKSGGAIGGGKTRPIVDRFYDNPGQMFDGRAYPKGAWVLHMLRRRVGDETFWKILNRYCTKNALGSVETIDLRKAVEEVTGTSFERFFYDWTERPGHPVVELAYTWNEGEKTAEVRVKQTQTFTLGESPRRGDRNERRDESRDKQAQTANDDEPKVEPFHFPLALEFRFDDDTPPVVVRREITDVDSLILTKLPRNPAMLRVDPDQAVLMECHEDKGRDLWAAQLTGDPSAVGRIRAMDALADDESDATKTMLAAAFQSEQFPAVRERLARKLGELKGDAARDALLNGLNSPDARVRHASVDALGGFKDDKAAIDAVRTIVAKTDESYGVQAGAIGAYAKLNDADVLDVILPALDRNSHREQVRNAVLSALGEMDPSDPDEAQKIVQTLVDWSKPAKPRECRQTAMRGLGVWAARPAAAEAVVEQALQAITDGLDIQDRRSRWTAIAALNGMGQKAAPALAKLRKISEEEATEGIRNAAKDAIREIQKDSPAHEQLAKLQQQIDDLRAENRKLQESVQALEAKRDSVHVDASSSAAAAKSPGHGA